MLKNYLTVYLLDLAIPYWKHTKAKNYLKAMRIFSQEEVNNAVKMHDVWVEFAESLKEVRYS